MTWQGFGILFCNDSYPQRIVIEMEETPIYRVQI